MSERDLEFEPGAALDECIENLNSNSYWRSIPPQPAARRLFHLWQDLRRNRYQADKRLSLELYASQQLAVQMTRRLGAELSADIGSILEKLCSQLVRCRHAGRHLTSKVHRFKDARELVRYLLESRQLKGVWHNASRFDELDPDFLFTEDSDHFPFDSDNHVEG